MPAVPPPPGLVRPRSPSNPGTSEGALWQALGAIQSDVSEVKSAVAEMKLAQANSGASTRNQTLQIIAGCVTAVVTAVAGARLTAPTPPPTQTVVQKSAFDRALEACKLIQTDTDRGLCIVKVATDAAGLGPR